MNVKQEVIENMNYYLQPNDLIVLAVILCILIALMVYVYYVMADREDAPVSKEELGYVALTTIISALLSGGIMYGLLSMRFQGIYPPVDGIDMGEPPF